MITTDISQERLNKAAYILKAVAHPVRLAILELLNMNERMGVTEICEVLNCEQSLMSHHLINLKLKGNQGRTECVLLVERKRSNKVD
jgi:ArsR family transcriptional regulator